VAERKIVGDGGGRFMRQIVGDGGGCFMLVAA
jgi:hypothetical protein